LRSFSQAERPAPPTERLYDHFDMAVQASPRIRVVVAVTVVLAAVLFAALLPFTSSSVTLRAGDIAFRTVRAPRDISFESPALTAKRQNDAAAAVPESLIYDPSIAVGQQTALSNLLSRISTIRDDTTQNAATKQQSLSRVDLLNGLSQRSASLLIALNPDDWQTVQAAARKTLGTILDSSLPPSQVNDTRQRVLNFVDPSFDRDTATLISEIVRPLVVANLTVDQARTEAQRQAARASIAPVRVTYAANQAIVEKDTPVTAEAREALLQAGLLNERWDADLLGSVALMAGLTAIGIVAAAQALRPSVFSNYRQLVALALAVAVPVFAMKFYLPLILPDEDRHFLVFVMPLAAAAMVVTGIVGAELALVTAIAIALLATFGAVYLADLTVVGLAGTVDLVRLAVASGFAGVAAVISLRSVERFSHYLIGGFAVAVSVFAVLTATWLIDPNRETNDFAWILVASVANGAISAFLSVGIFVTLGSLFGITTRVQLLEMSQLSQPLLRRLQDEAPATFQHSVIVANLAEKGAYVIGADAVLARVGSYYHDIGKLMRPGFFVENQFGGGNPHDALEPRDSARIIIDHVTEGLELARAYGLPPKVAAFIPEHHGTRLVTYFYRKASDEDPALAPEEFRYPGPKPQSRETAIAMLADSCEAVVRASPLHTAERISELVDEVFAERLSEGQLDDSELTLRNLRLLAQSFKETLRAVYHPRVEYPAPTTAELRLRRLPRPRLLDRRP
jgi:putative nucleotidyltransferase with HDIG domain